MYGSRGGSQKGRGRTQGRGGWKGRASSQPTEGGWERPRCKRDAYSGGKGEAREVHGISAIEMREQWHLQVARPYPGENGCGFIRRGGARNDRDIVDVEQLGDRLSLFNCEAMNRPGMWLSMLGATLQQGGKLARVYGEPEKLSLTGLPEVLNFLTSESGSAVVRAATHLDDTAGEQRSAASVKDALDTLPEHFATDDTVTGYQRLNMFSLHMYNLTSYMLQGKALMRNRDHWAAQLSTQLKMLPGKAREFVGRPDDDTSLVDMLIACYRVQVLSDSKTQGARGGCAADPLGAGDYDGGADGFYDPIEDYEDAEGAGPEDEAEDDDPLAAAAPASSRRFSTAKGAAGSASRRRGGGATASAAAAAETEEERRFARADDRKRPPDAERVEGSPARKRFSGNSRRRRGTVRRRTKAQQAQAYLPGLRWAGSPHQRRREKRARWTAPRALSRRRLLRHRSCSTGAWMNW